MMIVLTDENKDAARLPPGFSQPPEDTSILFIFDNGIDWIEVCEAGGAATMKFCEQGFADQKLIAKCVKELKTATKWPYFQHVREALAMSVGEVIVGDEYEP